MMDPEKLQELKDKGHLSEEEFVHEKKRAAAQITNKEEPRLAKNGIIYILLAWFLGMIGLHNFYAGYWVKGLIQLFLSILSPWFLFIPTIVVALWVFGELLLINKGANGILFSGNRKVIYFLRILAVVIMAIAFYSISFIDVSMTTTQINQIQ